MFKKTMLLAVFCLSSAMGEDLVYSLGMLNGRGWVSAGHEGKLMYVRALNDVFVTFKCDESTDFWPDNDKITIGEIADVIDQFFADAANRSVPILGALSWAKQKMSGADAAALESLAATLRKGSASTK